ncbi:MAG: hypothetical protein LBJ91_02415 [Clostridiales Family XIII bacterium]|nr:hypothetical protein [Clostridiales Family XIII bacterium]
MKTQAKVFIVLTRSPTLLSRLVRRVTRAKYTHAALALDEGLEYMFSFGRRRASNPFVGCFKRESLNDDIYGACAELPGVVAEIPVTPAQYAEICGIIESFLLNHHNYSYNTLGLIRNLARVPAENDKRFFCSEFVYYVLNESGVCDFGMLREGIRPEMLLKVNGRIAFEGDLILLRNKRAPQAGSRRFLKFYQ